MSAARDCAPAITFAFVDASLPDANVLVQALPADVELQLLPSGCDGVEFMAHILAGRSGIQTLHLICHGSPGALQLGTATLQRASLPRYLHTLDVLRDAMASDGQWLIDGGDVAQGLEGSRFVEALRLMTGLQVAAVCHKQGANGEANGKWHLVNQVATVACMVLTSVSALAQTAPDAGSLQQQIERNRAAPLPPKTALPIPDMPPVMSAPTGLAVTLKSVRFDGNTLLGAEQLQPALLPFLNRPLDYAQLQAVAAAAANTYRDAGWVVRSYLPQQDLTAGILTIQIVESVFGTVQLEGPAAQRVALTQITKYISASQASGQALNADALDRGLLLADDLPGVVVSGTMRPGQNEREVDLALKLGDEKLLVGDAALDNTGARSTGSTRLSANASLTSALGWGDLLGASAIHTEGSDYLRVSGTLPVGAQGWRVGASASALRYKLVTAEFSALEAQGSSNTFGLDASYPLLRQRQHNLYFSANVDHKTFDNQSAQATVSQYQVDVLSLGLSGNVFDNLGGGGASSASLTLGSGKLKLDGSPNQAADALTTRSDGAFNKLRYSLSRKQSLSADLSLLAALSGQSASKNLDSSEKFYLGGANGVRAYPSSEAGGSAGMLANLELSWRLPEGFSLTGFYDWGQVSVNRDNSFAGSPALNDYALKGAGLALGWQAGNGASVRATWARRIGDNPNPTATGNDQDGSLVTNRFWLAASLTF